MKTSICALILLVSSVLHAGNNPALEQAKVDFKKVNEAYARLKGISMDTYYMVYEDQNTQTVIEGKNGKLIKFNENVYTKIDGIETYAINDKLISICRETRQITVGDNKPWNLSPLQTNIDTLLSMCGEIKVDNVGLNEKRYTFSFGESGLEYNRMDIHIDVKNLRFVKVVLYYASKMNLNKDFFAEEKKPKLEIIYKNFKILDTSPGIFNQELYITSVNSKLKPTATYQNFKVLDLRNQTTIKTKK